MALRRLSTSSIQTNGKSSKLWDQTTFQSGMFALATVNLTTTASTITFSDIPANYKHLQIRMISRTDVAGSPIDGYRMRMNGDSITTYPYHIMIGSGTAVSSVSDTAQTYINNGDIAGLTATAGIFGTAIIDILDYASTTKLKTTRTLVGVDTNGGGSVRFISGLYRSLDPISSISFSSVNSANFVANTSFALYGIKAG